MSEAGRHIFGPHITIQSLQIFRPCSIIGQFLQSLDGLSTLISPDRIKNCMGRDAKCLNETSNNLMMPHLALLKLEKKGRLFAQKKVLYTIMLQCYMYNVIVHNLFRNSVEPLSWHIKKIIYRKVASSRPVYYSILELFGQRSQYKSIKFPLHIHSENALVYCSRLYGL